MFAISLDERGHALWGQILTQLFENLGDAVVTTQLEYRRRGGALYSTHGDYRDDGPVC